MPQSRYGGRDSSVESLLTLHLHVTVESELRRSGLQGQLRHTAVSMHICLKNLKRSM